MEPLPQTNCPQTTRNPELSETGDRGKNQRGTAIAHCSSLVKVLAHFNLKLIEPKLLGWV